MIWTILKREIKIFVAGNDLWNGERGALKRFPSAREREIIEHECRGERESDKESCFQIRM